MTPGFFLWGASVAYACVCVGVVAHRRTTLHSRFMLAGLGLDVTLVVALELSRHAVETVVSGEMSPTLRVHVWASTAAILCYLGAAALGALFVGRQRSSIVRFHRRVGWAAMSARTIGFITMLAASDVGLQGALMLAGLPASIAALAWSRLRESRAPHPARMEMLHRVVQDDL